MGYAFDGFWVLVSVLESLTSWDVRVVHVVASNDHVAVGAAVTDCLDVGAGNRAGYFFGEEFFEEGCRGSMVGKNRKKRRISVDFGQKKILIKLTTSNARQKLRFDMI